MGQPREDRPAEEAEARDPFAPVEASPRFATPIAVVAFVCAGLALVTGLAPLFGLLGMASGLVAHVKGSRLGLPATFAAGVAMIAGMAILEYLR